MGTRAAITVILAASALAVGFLFWLIYGFQLENEGSTRLSFLPATNALFNALSATAVILGIWRIKRRDLRGHGIFMVVAFLASCLFLVGYIMHHTVHGDTPFLTEGWLRPLYFTILISHIVLSIVVLPLVLCTMFFAVIRHWRAHRKIAPWTYPVWLYVSVTGVLVFVFLRFLNS